MSIAKQKLLKFIKKIILTNFTLESLICLKTKTGNTQDSERNYIQKIKNIFDDNNITYECASSQQSKDFRNINNSGLDLEIKKTDGSSIIFNDTCPNENIEYCILATGNKKYKPQILFINGNDIIKTSLWIQEYIKDITIIKNKYCRGENKKNLDLGMMRAYVRPNFSADISPLLQTY
jgi:hypothetical protein